MNSTPLPSSQSTIKKKNTAFIIQIRKKKKRNFFKQSRKMFLERLASKQADIEKQTPISK
jgi:hypothetical protein